MKILFHDVDGCLNASDGRQLANESIDFTAAEESSMAELGVAVEASSLDMMILNTGRSVAATLPMVEAIGCAKLGYVLGEHGAAGFDLRRGREIDLAALARESGQVDLVSAYASLSEVLRLMDWYGSKGHARLCDGIGHEVEILPKAANLTFVTPNGVPQDLMVSEIKALFREHSPFDMTRFVLHDSGCDGFVDVMSGVDKGHGVRLMSYFNGFAAAHTYGVGNGLNDLPMLRQVDTAICPANSEAEVKRFCREKAGHVSEHSYIDATLKWLEMMSG